MLNYVQALSPTWLSETRFGFTRTNYVGRPLGAGDPLFETIQIPNHRISDLVQTIPAFNVSGLTGPGPQGNVPNDSVQNQYQISQDFIYSTGSHTMKFGFEFIRRQLNNNFTGRPTGSLGFGGAYTNVNARVGSQGGEPLADFLLGLPNSVGRDILLGGFGRRGNVGSGYVQDDWKVNRRLTMNVGVRWDVWTPLTEVADRQANFDIATGDYLIAGEASSVGRGLRQTDWNNFGPRIGLAYDATGDGRTIIRSGYSISYIEDLSAGRTMLPINLPFAFNDLLSNAQGVIPTQTLSDGFPLPDFPEPGEISGVVNAVETNYRSTYVQSYSLGVQRELTPALAVDISYVGSKGTRLFTRVNPNQPEPGPGGLNPRRPFFSRWPDLNDISGLLSEGNSTFHSLQAKLTKRYSSGLFFLASYTYGRAIEGSEGVGETTAVANTQTTAQNPNDRAAEKALAGYHMKQRFIFSYGYELPFGSGKPFLTSGLAGHILGGWRLQGITSLMDGNPVSLQMQRNTLNNGGYQRPGPHL